MCRLEFRFQNLPFLKSAGKNVPLSCEREAYPSIFHRFQNVPAACEGSDLIKLSHVISSWEDESIPSPRDSFFPSGR